MSNDHFNLHWFYQRAVNEAHPPEVSEFVEIGVDSEDSKEFMRKRIEDSKKQIHFTALKFGNASANVGRFQDESIDFLFIGESQSGVEVERHLQEWWSKLKPNRWIAGGGYLNPIIAGTVNNFFGIERVIEEYGCWLVFKHPTERKCKECT